jgi:hypothetical protein
MIEFLIVAGLGFAIYLGYVEREEQSAHLIYLAVALIAAADAAFGNERRFYRGRFSDGCVRGDVSDGIGHLSHQRAVRSRRRSHPLAQA